VSTNVYQLQPPPAAAAGDTREPLADAVREASAYIRTLVDQHRRSHPRELPVEPQRPLTIYSFEEADPEPSARQVRRA